MEGEALTRLEKMCVARGDVLPRERGERPDRLGGAPISIYLPAGPARTRLRQAAQKRDWKLQQTVQALIDAVLEADICDAVLDDEEGRG